ncbi:MAG TPA: hypothetical protein VEV64_02745 [Rhizomicrobium sp.]|nr:hypothetical protein [Rhizomicrobium sp.]
MGSPGFEGIFTARGQRSLTNPVDRLLRWLVSAGDIDQIPAEINEGRR